MKKQVVFISGKMTGLPDYNRFRFFECEGYFQKLGFTVLNPAYHPDGLTHEQYMKICKAEIDAADIVYFMNNWTDSKGAKEEHAYAFSNEKICIYEGEEK